MALNIKNEQTHALIQKLSQATGENMTEAVTTAVRERLERLDRRDNAGMADRLLRIGKKCSQRLRGTARSVDHGDLLYDEKGLPR